MVVVSQEDLLPENVNKSLILVSSLTIKKLDSFFHFIVIMHLGVCTNTLSHLISLQS